MTTKIIWRLNEKPTTASLRELVKDKILTNEEAREILFNTETESERDIESYKQEVKFLKEVIEKLGDRSSIIQVVKEYVPHYITQPFYQPYYYYTTCGSAGGAGYTVSSASSLTGGSSNCYLSSGSTGGTSDMTNCSFSSIIS